jgi:hypothetical protein
LSARVTEIISINYVVYYGRTIRKVTGWGGGGGFKKKNRSREIKHKEKNRAPKNFEKKIGAETFQ